jgi:cation-transporting ATPase E
MPAVVMEGRRVINNIERSAALFLTKNIFSFLLAIVISIVLAERFPLSAARFMLFNVMLIGIPSFVLAMEPNTNIVKGRFIVNVLRNALPAGLTDFAALTALILISVRVGIPDDVISTMALYVIAFVGFMFLYKISRPLNALRIALILCMLLGFVLGAWLFGGFIGLEPLYGQDIWITVAFCGASAPVFVLLTLIMNSLGRKKGN